MTDIDDRERRCTDNYWNIFFDPSEVSYLWKPFYTHEESAAVILQFRDYLENNKRSIILSGKPYEQIDENAYWLFLVLSSLYPFDRTNCNQSQQEERNKRIQSLRTRLFEIKINILNILHTALKQSVSDSLFDKCLSVMEDTLSRKDFELCNKTQNIFHKGSVFNIPKGGGLYSLIVVVTEYEAELAVGVYDKTKRALLELQLTESDLENANSFYAAITQKDLRKKLLFILTRLGSLHHEWSVFFRTALLHNIELTEKAFPRINIPLAKEKELAPLLQTSSSLQKWTADILRSEDYVFHDLGRTSEIIFNGKRTHIKANNGAFYLSVLLENPGKDIPASKLSEFYNGYLRDEKIEFLLADIKNGFQIKSSFDSEQSNLDNKAIKECVKRRDDLREEMEVVSDTEELIEKEDELEKLNRILKKEGIDIHVTMKNVNAALQHRRTPKGNTASSMEKAIRRSIIEIKTSRKTPELYKHLMSSISFHRLSMLYDPHPLINWIVKR